MTGRPEALGLIPCILCHLEAPLETPRRYPTKQSTDGLSENLRNTVDSEHPLLYGGQARVSREGSGTHTWEDEDEASSQAPDHRNDPADVRNEECQQQGEQEPGEGLQQASPPLSAHIFLHGGALVAQPQAFHHRPMGRYLREALPAGPCSSSRS